MLKYTKFTLIFLNIFINHCLHKNLKFNRNKQLNVQLYNSLKKPIIVKYLIEKAYLISIWLFSILSASLFKYNFSLTMI